MNWGENAALLAFNFSFCVSHRVSWETLKTNFATGNFQVNCLCLLLCAGTPASLSDSQKEWVGAWVRGREGGKKRSLGIDDVLQGFKIGSVEKDGKVSSLV